MSVFLIKANFLGVWATAAPLWCSFRISLSSTGGWMFASLWFAVWMRVRSSATGVHYKPSLTCHKSVTAPLLPRLWGRVFAWVGFLRAEGVFQPGRWLRDVVPRSAHTASKTFNALGNRCCADGYHRANVSLNVSVHVHLCEPECHRVRLERYTVCFKASFQVLTWRRDVTDTISVLSAN